MYTNIKLLFLLLAFNASCNRRFVDTKDYVVPLLAVVAADIEPAVRQHLVEKMALVAKVS